MLWHWCFSASLQTTKSVTSLSATTNDSTVGEVLAVLALPLFFHGGAHGAGGIMMGAGRHKPMVPAMLIEGGANLALSVWLIPTMGIAGGVGHDDSIDRVEPAVLAVARAKCSRRTRGVVRGDHLADLSSTRRTNDDCLATRSDPGAGFSA